MRERTGPPVEEFHFMGWGFDIAALRGMLDRIPPPEEIRISVSAAARLLESDPGITPEGERWVPVTGVDVDWPHVGELSEEALESPLFVAPMGEIGRLVVDGWHRIALARRLSVDELPALLFTRTQITRVLLPRSSPLPPDRPNR